MKALIVLAAGGLLVGGMPVAAQTGGDRAVSALRDISMCLAKRRPTQARRFLDARDRAAASAQGAALYANMSCAGVSDAEASLAASSPTALQRGAMAEAMIATRYASASPAAQPVQQSYASDWAGTAGRPVAYDEMATCVATTDPAGVRRLIGTTPGGSDEAAAMTALRPALGPCLSTNVKLNAGRPGLRAALAEALYHRLSADRTAR